MRCIYGCELTGGRKNSGRRASCEWERLNAEEGKGECNQERRRAGMEPGTGRNAGISFSSNPCWGRGCLHVGEAMYRPVGEWGSGRQAHMATMALWWQPFTQPVVRVLSRQVLDVGRCIRSHRLHHTLMRQPIISCPLSEVNCAF